MCELWTGNLASYARFCKQRLDTHAQQEIRELARQKFKQRLLKDILTDLMICEIEGWGKMEYINEMKRLINDIGSIATIEA